MTVTVYTKPGCVQCTATFKKLDSLGVEYTAIDVSVDDDARHYITAQGYLQVPVVIAGADSWTGFRPDRLSRLASAAA